MLKRIFQNLSEVYAYRELIVTFVLREIKVRYKQTVLGMVWAVLQPFVTMVVFTIIFSKFAKLPSDGVPYPIFSYSALLPWSFFSTSLSAAIPSLISNTSLITKVYFPREILPISAVLSAFVDFCIASVIFLVLMVYYRIPLSVHCLFLAPLLVLQTLFALGIAFLFSALNVSFRDVRYAFPFIIQTWMYATPIAYPVSLVPERYRTLYMLNPMAGIIEGYRGVLLHHTVPDFRYMALSAGVAVVLFGLSYTYFKRAESAFADII